ncbi:MAG: hypothetical protein ACI9MR_001072 [Myxococcota bacterium]|jgi:hypothetical protein
MRVGAASDALCSVHHTLEFLMAANPLPFEDQQVTLISVREGDISVTSARALVVKPHKVALQIDLGLSKPPSWVDDQPVTMIYTSGNRVMRLRGVLEDEVAHDRITVKPVGEVKEGDRRDYRRADVAAKVYGAKLDAASPAEARTKQLALHIEPTDPAFTTQTVNISGSGLSFRSTAPFEAGDLVDLRLLLERPAASSVTMVGQVVRVFPAETDARIAVRFAELSESDQDVIVYTVFSNHFAEEGLVDALDELDDLDEIEPAAKA